MGEFSFFSALMRVSISLTDNSCQLQGHISSLFAQYPGINDFYRAKRPLDGSGSGR
jgi:hypothetical protein